MAGKNDDSDASVEVTVLPQTTMSAEMAAACVEMIKTSMKESKANAEKDLAAKIKKNCDEKFSEGTWHCIVGSSFGISMSFEAKNLMYAKVGRNHVVLFMSYDVDKYLSEVS